VNSQSEFFSGSSSWLKIIFESNEINIFAARKILPIAENGLLKVILKKDCTSLD